MNSVRQNNLSSKYHMFKQSGCKESKLQILSLWQKLPLLYVFFVNQVILLIIQKILTEFFTQFRDSCFVHEMKGCMYQMPGTSLYNTSVYSGGFITPLSSVTSAGRVEIAFNIWIRIFS